MICNIEKRQCVCVQKSIIILFMCDFYWLTEIVQILLLLSNCPNLKSENS